MKLDWKFALVCSVCGVITVLINWKTYLNKDEGLFTGFIIPYFSNIQLITEGFFFGFILSFLAITSYLLLNKK